MIGIFISTLVYVLTNISYFVILTPIEVLESPAIAMVIVLISLSALLLFFHT
jgi:hypothetical protein